MAPCSFDRKAWKRSAGLTAQPSKCESLSMTPERWHQITEMFHAARERDPGQREAFLAEVCREDATLRRQVQAMLDGHDDAGSFGETPLCTQPASGSPPEPDQDMRLSPGSRLGARWRLR